ncbi:hypothetical protein CASFOL_028762 [Castilleja foliolosa]|uniref:BAG domain-containing protein n=1 Tax=Castilleja foliolosa TaxID=1961234 RepID=A0ABD3CDM6_9LAMI
MSPQQPPRVVYTSWNNHLATAPNPNITEIPVNSPPPETTPISVPLPQSRQSSAAVKIQSAYRSHAVRALVRKIAAVDSEANHWQRLIQRQIRFQHIYHNCVWQETVDAVRTSQRERIKINEALMGLLFRLDSVPGRDPNIRELRRHVSRKIVRLQEILDGIRMDSLSDWVDISVNDFS